MIPKAAIKMRNGSGENCKKRKGQGRGGSSHGDEMPSGAAALQHGLERVVGSGCCSWSVAASSGFHHRSLNVLIPDPSVTKCQCHAMPACEMRSRVHSVQGIEATRHVLYVGHGSVVVAHHLLHEVGVARDLQTLQAAVRRKQKLRC